MSAFLLTIYRYFLFFVLVSKAGFFGIAYADDRGRLAVALGFQPGLPSMQVYIDNDPCAQQGESRLDVVVLVETAKAADDNNVLLGAVRSANQKYLTSLRRACHGFLDAKFMAQVTAFVGGMPVTQADVLNRPGRPLPEMTITAKRKLEDPASTTTPLGDVLNGFFDKFGPLGNGFEVAPSLDLEKATAAAERLENTNPEISEMLGQLVVRLYQYAQPHPMETSEQTQAKYEDLSERGSGMASNALLRQHYFDLGDLFQTIRQQRELDASQEELWTKLYPVYVQGIQNGSFAAHDLQLAAISAGAQISENGFSYEVYDGPRLEDVERGLAATTSKTSALGGIVGHTDFAKYAQTHYSCKDNWCDFGDGMSKWRLISRGRPNCNFQDDRNAVCRFPWRFNMQLSADFFGSNSIYQNIITTMNAVNWYPGQASFIKTNGTWEMSGAPDLAK